MAGLSATHYDSASIERINDFTVAALSGSNITGRALSDIAHGSGAGLRYVEFELFSRRGSQSWHWGGGFVDNTDNLADYLGAQSYQCLYQAIPLTEDHCVFAGNAVVIANVGGTAQIMPGARIGLWLDTATRRVWVATHSVDAVDGGWLPKLRSGRPDLGTDPVWTVPGTAPLRFAVVPGWGSSSNRNVVRVHTKHSSFLAIDTYGALPWDARMITLTGDHNPAHISSGEDILYAWFDHENPSEITTAPTSVGTTAAMSGPGYSIEVLTYLDPGQTGSLLLMKADGTPIACRSHYAPVVTP